MVVKLPVNKGSERVQLGENNFDIVFPKLYLCRKSAAFRKSLIRKLHYMKAITLSFAGLVAMIALFALPVGASASVNIDSIAPVVFDNGNGWESAIDGSSGDSFRWKVIFDVTSDDDVNAVSFDKIGDYIPKECFQFDEVTQSISDMYWEGDMTFPTTVGSHDYQVRLYGVNGAGKDFNCSDSNVVDTITLNDRVVTNIGNTNSGGNTGGGSGSVGNSTLAQLLAQVQALQAVVANWGKNPPTTPAPTTNAKCTALANKSVGTVLNGRSSANVVLQGFLLSEGMSIPALAEGASFGFYGPQTQAAVGTYKAMNQCI